MSGEVNALEAAKKSLAITQKKVSTALVEAKKKSKRGKAATGTTTKKRSGKRRRSRK